MGDPWQKKKFEQFLEMLKKFARPGFCLIRTQEARKREEKKNRRRKRRRSEEGHLLLFSRFKEKVESLEKIQRALG